MKIHIPKASGVLALLALLLTLNFDVSTTCAQGTAFTYDGLLEKGSAPQSGTFTFTFTLYDVVTGGSPVAATFITNGVPVKTGAFTVTMDFGGAVWNGETNWLEISVEANGDAGPTMLTPRQQVMPTPYAIFAETASNLSGTLPIAPLDGTINNSQLANSSITINTGTGLSSSGGPVALGGSITLNNTGVTSLTGGDGVTVSGTTGNVTLGLGSSLTLANLPVAITTAENGWLLSADMNGNYFAGVFAGNPVQPGVNNTAEGSGALQAISSGVANTANGEDALQGDNSGSENTANGSGALSDNRGGSYNVADGANSLGMGMDGWYNTAVGANTLSGVTSKAGSNNIAIGYQAGSAFNGIESSNIDIGNIGVGGESGITRIGTPGIQTAAYIAGIITGNGSGLTSLNGSQIAGGTINNSQLANSSITINTGTGLSSSGSPVALGGTITLNNTGVTSLTGGDGVTVSGATGELTLGLGSTLTLPGLPVTITAGNGGSLLYADNNQNFFTGPNNAGNTTTTGSGNTATGANVLLDNTIGSFNTADGFDALVGNTSGSINTATGADTLLNNSSGSGNTADGAYALANNASGNDNTANGAYALSGSESGNGNTANGFYALLDNESGNGNTADGFDALAFNESGSFNTALGYDALNLLGASRGNGGTNNIAIGNEAGSAFTGIESSNIDIGNIGVLGENNITRIGTPGIQTAAYIAGIINGDGSGLVNLNGSQITGGTINNSQLANSSITINTGTGLSASGSPVALGGTITLNNTGVTSLTGGDGVTVSGATGDLTLGLGSTLTLQNLPVAINTGNRSLLYADNNGNYFAGVGAGYPSTSGSGNTAVGLNALSSNSGGSDNTANGMDALAGNNSGSDNTANGMYTLSSNISGSDNTANGWSALFDNQSGSYNVGDGASALEFNNGGAYNTAVGGAALGLLGRNTGPGGTNNIAIGFEAGSAFTGNESSNIDIGSIGVQGESSITRIGTPGIQTAAYIAGIITGNGSGLTSLNGSQITGGTINNSQLAHSSITVNTGTGLSAAGSPVALGGTITLNNTGVTSLTGGGGVTVSASSGAVTLGSTATSLNVDNTIVSRDGTGSFAAQNLTLAGILNLPAPPVTINSGASSLLLGDGNRDLFVGLAAGNLTSGAGDNTALGYESLQAVTSGNQNVAVGSYSLADDTTGNLNVGVGYLALQQNTDGFGNTACGWESLRVNTDGWYDTGVGTWALQANTTGNNNTAVGYDALGGNTTGTENTAYGVHANLYNTTGSNNVAVGWWSLNYCPDGSSNIAVGYEAGINFEDTESGNIDIGNAGEYGDNNTIRIGSVNNAGSNEVANTYIAGIWAVPVSSGLPVVVDSSGHLGVQASSASYGSGNTADGYQALNGNTSGTENVAVGALALAFNTNGGENTACGVSALQDNTSGSYNTAIGQGSLAYNYTGTFNTAVGADALQQLSSGTGNIAIGAEAGSQMTGNFNDDIDIGNMGEVGDNNIIRIGSHGIQTDAYIAGVCNTDGFGCKQGVGSQVYGNAFNFWWSGSQLSAYVDITDIGTVNVTVSDRRLKENIEPMTDDALTRVMALKPSSFKYKNIPGTIFHGDDQTKEGFIADELQQVIPSAVNGEKDALTSKGTIQPQTLNLMPVVAVLTKAVQDQQKEIDDLKAMVKTLSARK